MTAPPEWFVKALAAFNGISGWVWPLLAAAGTIVLCAPIPDLAEFRRDQVYWILPTTIVFGALAFVKPAEWVQASVARAWQRRAKRRAREKAEAKTLAHMDTLSSEEKVILSKCVSRGQRTYVISTIMMAYSPGEIMAQRKSFGAATALVSKGILVLPSRTGSELPYTIPVFVWDELQRREEVAKR